VTTVGFAVKGLIAFVVLALALPTALAAFTDGLAATFDSLQELLGH
jgi:flagellar biosynthesis protein FliR